MLINLEIQEVERKGTIQQIKLVQDKFFGNLLLVTKNDRGHSPVINLKHFNSFIPL